MLLIVQGLEGSGEGIKGKMALLDGLIRFTLGSNSGSFPNAKESAKGVSGVFRTLLF